MFSVSPRSIKISLVLIGAATAGVIFAGCSKSPTPSADAQPSVTAQTPTNTETAPMMTPTSSPVVKAQTTQQAVTNEGAQLNSLNQNSTAVDQSLNDQPINVN